MKFLVLQHEPHEGPGRYERLAHDAGIELDTVRLWETSSRAPGSRMPLLTDYKNYAGAFIMGGSQGVNDPPNKYPRRQEEINFINNFQSPVLGTCLGSQIINYAKGG